MEKYVLLFFGYCSISFEKTTFFTDIWIKKLKCGYIAWSWPDQVFLEAKHLHVLDNFWPIVLQQ